MVQIQDEQRSIQMTGSTLLAGYHLHGKNKTLPRKKTTTKTQQQQNKNKINKNYIHVNPVYSQTKSAL